MGRPLAPSEDIIAYIKEMETFTEIAKHLPGDRPNVITGGYGETQGTYPGQVWTLESADLQLRRRIQGLALGVDALVKPELTQGQFDALVDFAYNCGLSAFEHSTLLRRLNAGDLMGADEEFGRWNRANGHILKGLTKRRAYEAALFAGSKQPTS